ncbi:uncharacterized protein LOC143282852 [Babylonia areolata]|uniref:uncharacterized protein LOC143282852 n=1 Tax=Babylonia areolata TaxID=304850 RepID=UPI003FD0E95B
MGMNESKVSNHTAKGWEIVTYNGYDTFYWIPREKRFAPTGGSPITVRGMPGYGGVQVAVIYGIFVDKKNIICDLFFVPHESELAIRVVTPDGGVEQFDGKGVKMLKKGKTLRVDKDFFNDVFLPVCKSVVGMAGPIIAKYVCG